MDRLALRGGRKRRIEARANEPLDRLRSTFTLGIGCPQGNRHDGVGREEVPFAATSFQQRRSYPVLWGLPHGCGSLLEWPWLGKDCRAGAFFFLSCPPLRPFDLELIPAFVYQNCMMLIVERTIRSTICSVSVGQVSNLSLSSMTSWKLVLLIDGERS
jgi:hypothetical protein